MALCAAAELPQPAKSGIALGYKTVVGGQFLAIADVRPTAPEVRKSTLGRAFQSLPSTASAQSWPDATSSRWVLPTLLVVVDSPVTTASESS